jgi:hypothetical protein
MKSRKITSVEAKKHSPLGACVGQMISIWPTDEMGIERCGHIDLARACKARTMLARMASSSRYNLIGSGTGRVSGRLFQIFFRISRNIRIDVCTIQVIVSQGRINLGQA